MGVTFSDISTTTMVAWRHDAAAGAAEIPEPAAEGARVHGGPAATPVPNLIARTA